MDKRIQAYSPLQAGGGVAQMVGCTCMGVFMDADRSKERDCIYDE